MNTISSIAIIGKSIVVAPTESSPAVTNTTTTSSIANGKAIGVALIESSPAITTTTTTTSSIANGKAIGVALIESSPAITTTTTTSSIANGGLGFPAVTNTTTTSSIGNGEAIGVAPVESSPAFTNTSTTTTSAIANFPESPMSFHIASTNLNLHSPQNTTSTYATKFSSFSPASVKVKDEVDADMITIAGVPLLKKFHELMMFRSPNAVIEGRKDLPKDLLPTILGAFDTMEEVVEAVARNYNNTFGVIRKGLRTNSKKCGFLGYVICAAGGTHGKDARIDCCGWKITFECTLKKDVLNNTDTYQWYLKSINDNHTGHAFSNKIEAILADRNRKHIPKPLLAKMKVMLDANTGNPSSREINNILTGLAALEKLPITWDTKCVQNAFSSNNGKRSFDAQGLREKLETRKIEEGLEYSDCMDGDGRLSLVIAEVKGGREAYAIDGPRAVLLYDTTHGTNIYGAKLGLLCVVDRLGKTTIIGITIICGDEDANKFKWLFEKFLVMFQVEPCVILTDSCAKQAKAIDEVFKSTRQLLCVWHISKNFFNHIRPIVGKEFDTVNKCFWKLAKNSDDRSLPSFEAEWSALTKMVENFAATGNYTISSPDKVELAMRWLKTTLYDKREQWAYRWTWSVFTAGCHASQRSESLHAAIKSVMRMANFSFVALFDGLVGYQDDKDLFKHVHHIRFCNKLMNFQLRGGAAPSSGFFLDRAKLTLNEYGYSKFEFQWSQKDNYLTTKVYAVDGITILGWRVTRRTYETTEIPTCTEVAPAGISTATAATGVPGISTATAETGVPGEEGLLDDGMTAGKMVSAKAVVTTEACIFIDDGTDDGLDCDKCEDRFVSIAGRCSCQYKVRCLLQSKTQSKYLRGSFLILK